MVLAWKQIDQRNSIETPEINMFVYCQLIYSKEYTLGKELFSINVLEINRSLNFKKKRRSKKKKGEEERSSASTIWVSYSETA